MNRGRGFERLVVVMLLGWGIAGCVAGSTSAPTASLPLATPMPCDPVLLDFALTAAEEFDGWGQITLARSVDIAPDDAVRVARRAFAALDTIAPVVCLGQTRMVGDDSPRAVYAVIWADNDQLDAVWIDAAGRGLVLLTPSGRP